jgi:uncharacterized phage protein (TIGR01671 family)
MKFRVYDKLREQYIYYNDKKYMGHFYLTLDGKFYNFHNGSGGGEYVVQMYTGVKDRNEKEIYEGDIIRTTGGESHPNVGLVYFACGAFLIDGAGLLHDEVTSLKPDFAQDLEVIGNKCENPELRYDND